MREWDNKRLSASKGFPIIETGPSHRRNDGHLNESSWISHYVPFPHRMRSLGFLGPVQGSPDCDCHFTVTVKSTK
jgi:hypothetical protein